MTGVLLHPRALQGDDANDGYVLRTVGGVPMWLPGGIPVGGSTGQVLTKVSGADYDADWETPSAGGGSGLRSLAMPHGTLERKYTFDTDVQGWTASGGTLAQDATLNRLKHTVAATGTNYILLEPSSAANVADGEVVFDLNERTSSANPHDTGAVFRATDANNHYYVQIRLLGGTNATAYWYKRVSGTYTQLAATAIVQMPIFPASGKIRARVMVRFIGSWIGAWLNEVFLGATQDTTYTTGRCGIWNYARTSASEISYFDNAAVYSLSSTWTAPAYD